MEWLYYLLEANLYLLLFYGFYRLLLQHETFYNSNRYYLMLSSVTAFILPVLQLGFLNPVPIVDNILFPPPILYTEGQLTKTSLTTFQETVDYTTYLYPIYLLIAVCFAVKLVFNISKIIRLWIKAKKQTNGKITLIELTDQKSAFSFFNLLFIHPHLAEKQTVLKHEMVHIKQKHSLDILFFEILQIVCWFNPFIYFMKKDIKLLHEYIADELSTTSGLQKHEYAMFLIENSFGVIPTPLTNQIFNQSILKRRINMLNKKRTAGWARLRLLLALPMVMGMLCVSTLAFTKDYGYVDILSNVKSLQDTTKKINKPLPPPPKADQVKFPPPILKQWFTPYYTKDKTTGEPIFNEKRYILINGKAIQNINLFYGVSNAESVRYLNNKSATAKYGAKGKNGAVEITGQNIKYFDKVTIPSLPPVEPPPPRQDQVKFPPPIKAKIGKTYFYPSRSVDKEGNINGLDKRYIVINGKKVEDINTFFGVANTTKIVSLNGPEAVKKYGVDAKYGAVEITGSNIKYLKSIADGPPPPIMEKVKFPPPIVKPDGKNLKTPPPVEPPPPGYKPKRDLVKFPPPIVKPDKSKSKIVEGDPIKQQEMLEVVIKEDPTKSQNKLNDEIKEVIIKKVNPINKTN